MAKRRVVVTGAAGYISAQLLPAFRERYDLVLLDLAKETKEGRIDEIQEVDLSSPGATSSPAAGRCPSDRAMTAQRQRLPNRRPAHTETLDVGGQTFTA